jgi:uncharacterized membrane protein
MTLTSFWLLRVARSHPRTIAGALAGLLTFAVLPPDWRGTTRSVLAWDVGAVTLMVLAGVMFAREGGDTTMAANAEQQQEGEWTAFWFTLAGVVFSFVALTQELGHVKDMTEANRSMHVTLVAATLLISWLVTHVVFAMRYAHEYYAVGPAGTVDGGLQFPGDDTPDYWDFVYFSIVLGMTFQVSDVQITSRKLRRLATAHGLIGFLFNTVIVALTVNIAAGLMN